jgi:hypothetical protein
MKLISRIGVVVLTAFALCANAGNITVTGSDTLVILAQKWAEVYMGLHPDVKIQVSGGGSGVGFAALQNQSTDIADASRQIKPAEVLACVKAFGKKPTEYKVALDGLSVYVNDANPIGLQPGKQFGKLRVLQGSCAPQQGLCRERPNDAGDGRVGAGGVEGQGWDWLRRRGVRGWHTGSGSQEGCKLSRDCPQ